MKFSRQRELILNYVLNDDKHSTADDIYISLKANNPELSLGTVYRNLAKLVEMNLIKKVSFPNQNDRFDRNLKSHIHLICNSCKTITDIDSFDITLLENAITDKNIEIKHFDLILYGTCPNCNNKKI